MRLPDPGGEPMRRILTVLGTLVLGLGLMFATATVASAAPKDPKPSICERKPDKKNCPKDGVIIHSGPGAVTVEPGPFFLERVGVVCSPGEYVTGSGTITTQSGDITYDIVTTSPIAGEGSGFYAV